MLITYLPLLKPGSLRKAFEGSHVQRAPCTIFEKTIRTGEDGEYTTRVMAVG